MVSDVQPFQPKLPARIAGIVFWVLVLIGFLVAVFLLHEAESEIEKRNLSNAQLLAYDLEEILEKVGPTATIEESRGRLNLRINRLRDAMGYSAIYLNDSSEGVDDGVFFGTPGDADDVISQVITYYPRGLNTTKDISFSAYFPNSKACLLYTSDAADESSSV